MTHLLFFIPEIQEQKEFEAPEKKDPPRPGFLEIYQKKVERHKPTQKHVNQIAAAEQQNQAPDLAMQKLFLSRLLSLGGRPPVISPTDPKASAVLLHALQAERCGARRPFAQSTDLHAMPQFPIVRTMEL